MAYLGQFISAQFDSWRRTIDVGFFVTNRQKWAEKSSDKMDLMLSVLFLSNAFIIQNYFWYCI